LALRIDKPSPDVSASRGLRREERLARLEKSLAQLKPVQREIIVLAKIEGLTAREITRRLGLSEAAVRQAISRGLKQLRERFGDTESLHLPDRRLDGDSDDAREREV
jgi:RNA polymerase sigma factor (sigma-70 family)